MLGDGALLFDTVAGEASTLAGSNLMSLLGLS